MPAVCDAPVESVPTSETVYCPAASVWPLLVVPLKVTVPDEPADRQGADHGAGGVGDRHVSVGQRRRAELEGHRLRDGAGGRYGNRGDVRRHRMPDHAGILAGGEAGERRVHRAQRGVALHELLDGGELRELGDELGRVGRLHRVLILQLGRQQLQELIHLRVVRLRPHLAGGRGAGERTHRGGSQAGSGSGGHAETPSIQAMMLSRPWVGRSRADGCAAMSGRAGWMRMAEALAEDVGG